MTKKKILLFLAVVMLYLTANMSGVFAWFTAYDSKELTVTSGVFVKPYLVSGEEFNEITSPVKSTVKKSGVYEYDSRLVGLQRRQNKI